MQQVGNYYAGKLKRRILVGCLTTLIGVPCMGGCLIGIFGFLLPWLSTLDNKSMPMVLLLLFVLVLVILLGGGLVTALFVIARRTRTLDAIFKPLDLTGSTYMLYGRQYHGQMNGRTLDIYIFRGPTVEFHLSTPVQTRFQVFPSASVPASVGQAFGKQPVQIRDPQYGDYALFPLDYAWVQSLLGLPAVLPAIQTLMTRGADWAVFRRTELQPGEVVLNLYRSRSWFSDSLAELDVRAWLGCLQVLAESAESLPLPVVSASAQPAEYQTRQKMSKLLTISIVLIVFIMPLCMIAIGVIAYLFAISS